MTEPRERPIIFSGPMIKAILDGRKSQTRRIVKFVPSLGEPQAWCARAAAREQGFVHIVGDYRRFCPYGVAGDRLWVRETWAAHFMYDDEPPTLARTSPRLDGDNIWFAADGDEAPGSCGCPARGRRGKWRPSIHMPRWASRIALEVVSVRVERLQDISEEDASAEGVTFGDDPMSATTAREAFLLLWNAINGKRAPWALNPFVWVISFRRMQ